MPLSPNRPDRLSLVRHRPQIVTGALCVSGSGDYDFYVDNALAACVRIVCADAPARRDIGRHVTAPKTP
ncbi:hypothetical protein FMEAI12_4250002 [Parafrankia sp. Ea1.12]|nr:hypothetical protein FMEAI12_4250002 [Parafrankia sp. Ea1.12]